MSDAASTQGVASDRDVTCRSCGLRFRGRYCNRCGEKVLDEQDLRLRRLIAEWLGALTFADSTLWTTLKTIAVEPGRFTRDYVDGRRRRYMKPLAVFFLANLFYFLMPLMNTFYSTLAWKVSAGNITHGALAERMVDERLDERQMSFELYAEVYENKTKELSKLLLIWIAVAMSVPLWWIHGTRDHWYLESVLLALELTTFMILFAVQAQGILLMTLNALGIRILSGEAVVSSIGGALLLYFLLGVERRFYGRSGRRSWGHAALGALAFVLVIQLYRALLFFVTFWLT